MDVGTPVAQKGKGVPMGVITFPPQHLEEVEPTEGNYPDERRMAVRKGAYQDAGALISHTFPGKNCFPLHQSALPKVLKCL
jgi:hypothetical protein